MVDLDIVGRLAVITIDRPHARNAISLDTMDQLDKALDGACGARALAITGGGDRAFVSGGDLKELAALRTELEASQMAWRMRTICDRIAGFPGPVIAALNGHTLGGGAEFAESWRTTAALLARRPAGEIKRVLGGVPATEAVSAFARLWASDEHWTAADAVMNKAR